MPWNETNAMEQRKLFIKAWLSQRYSKTALCEQFGVSRPTANKWIKRHEQVGFDGLSELSRKPHHSPHATPAWICEWLIAEKRKRPSWGAKKLLDLFARVHPTVKKPADSTGDLILARAGLVKLKAHLGLPQYDLATQQRVLDDFRRDYNELRSHEGIGRQTPFELYLPSNRIYTGNIEPYDYGDVELRKVKGSGEVKWQGETYSLTQVLANEPVAFIPYADGIWDIYYRFYFLG